MTSLSSGYALTFPVFLAEGTPEGMFLLTGEVVGTAINLHGQFMMTAGHVAKAIQAANRQIGVIGLADPGTGNFKGAPIVDIELLPGDIAILKVEFVFPESAAWFVTPKWRSIPLDTFEHIRSLGFPYGMHRVDEKLSSVQRGFQGHIVSHLIEFKPIGWAGSAFPAYEVSFSAPRGLSGAPLLNCVANVEVHGVVIGNSETKMLVFESEERMAESAGTTIVERYESLRLGVAVTGDFILSSSSALLQGPIGKFLASKGLVV